MPDDILGKHSSMTSDSDLVSSGAWFEFLSGYSQPPIRCLFLLENAMHQATMEKSSQNQELPKDCNNCESIKKSPVIDSSFDGNNCVCAWKAPNCSFRGSAQTRNVINFQPAPFFALRTETNYTNKLFLLSKQNKL